MADFWVETGVTNNVQWMNGIIKIFNVKLNVRCFVEDGMLIDAGCASMEQQFLSWIHKQKVDAVLLTHSHEDHVGTCYLLDKSYPIYLHPMSIPEITQKATYPLYRKIFWGKRQPFQAMEMPSEIILNNSIWQTIYTPGHSQDHYSFLNKTSGNLYTGDLFVHPVTKVILRNESIPQIINSLTTILDLDFNHVFCQHAGYVPNGREKLIEKRDNLLQMQQQVLALVDKGYSQKEIVKTLFSKKYPIIFFSSGEWHSKHIVSSILEERKTVIK